MSFSTFVLVYVVLVVGLSVVMYWLSRGKVRESCDWCEGPMHGSGVRHRDGRRMCSACYQLFGLPRSWEVADE